jgi:molecular chaperone DnaK (HSP70)
MSEKYHNVIGIDLGTTYSAVATNNKYNDSTEILKTEKGDTTIPSVVSFDKTNKKAYAGMDAKNNYPVDPANTILEIKREMGEVVNERNIGQLQKLGLNPRVNEDPYKVLFADEWYLPQEISALILMEAKATAEKALGETINDAVITVPAYFTEKQKKATEEAALLAGLYPRQLIPEPTAAAICYGIDMRPEQKVTYLIYDLGGGTFDVSIIEVEDNKINVIATSGDARLGGSDFDNTITAWVLAELKEKHNADISANTLAIAKIKAAAESAKKILSQFDTASIDLSFLNIPNVANINISVKQFETLIEPILTKSLNKVQEAIQIAKNEKGIENIDNILLVGGSTKTPMVKRMLVEYFGKGDDFILGDAAVDTVVARGAAIMAKKFEATPGEFDIKKRKEAKLMSKDTDLIDDPSLITEYSLGIGIENDKVAKIIERGRNLPAKQERGGFVNGGPSEYIPVPIFQGEGEYTYDNTLIGSLNIGPMEPKPAGEHQFVVIFNIDKNGLLSMTINHINENKSYSAEFDQKTGIGGDDKMTIIRHKLKDMFWHKGSGTPIPPKPTAAPKVESSVPPPVTSTVPPPVAPKPKAEAQPAKTEKAADIAIAIKPIPGQFSEIVTSAQSILALLTDNALIDKYNAFINSVNKGMSEDELADAGDELAEIVENLNKIYENGLMIAKNPVPGEFAELVDKCKTQFSKTKNKALQTAYNTFIDAINSRKSDDEVINLGDSLMDVLEKLPESSDDGQVKEPVKEVPDKYKMLLRRSKKQILKDQDPQLIAAYNAFVDALNKNADDAELAKLDGELNKVFQGAKTN